MTYTDKLKAALEWLGTRWVLHPKSTFDTGRWIDHRATFLMAYMARETT